MVFANPDQDTPLVMLIVDPQVGFIEEERDGPAIEAIKREAESGRYQAIGVSRLITPQDGPFAVIADWTMDEEESEIHPTIAELDPDPVIIKTGYAPTREALQDFAGECTLHLVGWETDACVYATMFAAFDAGIDTYVLGGGCTTAAGAMSHQAALALINRQFPGRVLSH